MRAATQTKKKKISKQQSNLLSSQKEFSNVLSHKKTASFASSEMLKSSLKSDLVFNDITCILCKIIGPYENLYSMLQNKMATAN